MQTTSKGTGSHAGPSDAVQDDEGCRPWRERALAALRDSAWTALGGKVAAYVAGFFALALVGSGHALSLLPARPANPGSPADPTAGLAMVAGDPAPLGSTGSPPPQATSEPAANAGAAAVEPPPPSDGGTGAPAGVTADGKVVLNLATEADLMRLPGVGPAKAAAILALRAKLKRFRKVDDLLRVKGLGRRSLKRLRPLVLVDPP
ncbi:ComEA family DNA-binding protein [Sorangium atrum]|uniref:Helix-hairpin-helix domain-containing protein n=1 Tax=Sorangium atrum TaxID=2995308 RepID=A0ABT5CCV6_9BACT|nr:helix-hairpin-helix domain-containing protein [Sorangium aterium]MDC0684274.1 helix-hairpin-helix domain-containing protein [Sorangium aterium]